jgi:hypothetical protein
MKLRYVAILLGFVGAVGVVGASLAFDVHSLDNAVLMGGSLYLMFTAAVMLVHLAIAREQAEILWRNPKFVRGLYGAFIATEAAFVVAGAIGIASSDRWNILALSACALGVFVLMYWVHLASRGWVVRG